MIICVLIPFFATTVEQQRQPLLADELLILSDSSRKVRRIAAVSRKVAQLEIRSGMVLRHAQALVPELTVLPLSPLHYRESLDRLIETLRTFSDRIEIAYKGWGSGDEKTMLSMQSASSSMNPAVAFIDIGTLKPKTMYQLGQQLQDALKLSLFSTQIGIASNRFTAWVAAIAAREGTIALVNKGEEKWMLTCHPVSLLPLEEKVLRRLWWLGIHTLGDFSCLPSAAIRPQFGKEGQRAYQLAQGIDATPIRILSRQCEIKRTFAFDGAVSDGQIISATLKKLTSDLVVLLGRSGATTRRVRLTLVLSDKGAYEYEKSLRRRSNTITQLQNALQGLLDRAQITSPVSEIMVSLGDIVPLAAQQLELFPTMCVVESRQAVLDDLITRYGERFFTASVTDEQALLPQNQIEFKTVEIA